MLGKVVTDQEFETRVVKEKNIQSMQAFVEARRLSEKQIDRVLENCEARHDSVFDWAFYTGGRVARFQKLTEKQVWLALKGDTSAAANALIWQDVTNEQLDWVLGGEYRIRYCVVLDAAELRKRGVPKGEELDKAVSMRGALRGG